MALTEHLETTVGNPNSPYTLFDKTLNQMSNPELRVTLAVIRLGETFFLLDDKHVYSFIAYFTGLADEELTAGLEAVLSRGLYKKQTFLKAAGTEGIEVG